MINCIVNDRMRPYIFNAACKASERAQLVSPLIVEYILHIYTIKVCIIHVLNLTHLCEFGLNVSHRQ